MDALYDILIDVFGDSSVMMLALLVFLATAVLAFGVMATLHSRRAVTRRAAGINEHSGDSAEQNPLRQSSLRAVQRILDYTSKHYSASDKGEGKILRRRMVHAGIFDPRAIALFFVARTALAVGLGCAVFILLPMVWTQTPAIFWLSVMLGGIVGYIGPSLYIDRRIAKRRAEHQSGFPDFMDLLVVCADSGLSMEAALERVGRELGDTYPSLCANIHMTNLEIRAGRSMTEALEHFGDRLGLEEARSFATLIQQSAELGSSITDALRVYSDDMRHKRLSRAEEKAYSLPAKLSIPMMVCIFPVLFVVILLPVVVRLYTGHY
ncbi:MAG: tight adherence protein [Alphaproteobacteria bacterium]|jgi:tight adherence protein C|nr:tight adherence protein [Alphaproteobacteria bacterium]MEA2988391.1 tight adherence protein [Alphaproteobacteria bacterium]